MKKTITGILSTIFIICLLACGGSGSSKITHEQIFIEHIVTNNINVEDLFDTIRFLPLDENQPFIPRVKKIMCQNDTMYISDGAKIYLFDENGLTISVIDREGKAGYEYLSLMDFDVTENRVIVLDGKGMKILIYDKKGDFISSAKLNIFASTIVAQSDTMVIVNNNYSFSEEAMRGKLSKINMKTGEISYFGRFNRNKINYMHILGGSNFYKNDDGIYFYERFSPDVYKIDDDSMSLSKNIRFSNTPNDEYYDSNFGDVMEFIESFNSNKYASGTSNFYCDDSKIIFGFNYDKTLCYCSYDKEKKEVDYLGEIFLYDSVVINDIFFSGNKAVIYIPSEKLIDAAKTNAEIADLVKKYNISDTSNAFLILATI